MGGGGGARLGIGGIVVLVVLSVVFKKDLITPMLGGEGTVPGALAPQSGGSAAPLNDPSEERMVQFVSSVLDSVQSTWARNLQSYADAKLVLFRGSTPSACGLGQAASGPFYCPGDRKVYLDLGFFDQLDDQFGAPGDFAQAYVIAHEIGHHVQNLLGTERELRRLQSQSPGQANRLSVAMELQADCYAGVWAHDASRAGTLETGDIDEGLGAAAAVGDDRLQKGAGQAVHPESFTHGSSAQRQRWFRQGFDSGDARRCDTFAQLGR
jgi:predicted metalloprotease